MASAPVAATGAAAQLWWEGIDKARNRIVALKEILGPLSSLDVLQESERPAKGLLEDESVAGAIVGRLAEPGSGHGEDPLCRWLYDTFQTADLDLQAIILRFIPALCGVYLSRITSHADEPLAGFEAVLLALYTSETKARNGRPLVINIPDLAQPSLYHAPRLTPTAPLEPHLGQLAAPLEPQDAIKATKRACIIGVALELFCRRIAIMPSKAKIEACQCALRWANLSCSHDDQASTDTSLTIDTGSSPAKSSGGTPVRSNGERVMDANNYLFRPSPSSRQLPEIEIVGPGELFLGSKSPSHHSPAQHIHQNLLNESGSSPHGLSPAVPGKPGFMESIRSDKQKQPAVALQGTDDATNFINSLKQEGHGVRIQLPWELLQPLIKILGHCLMAPLNSQEVKDAASSAIKALYRRASHDLIPEAILATRSLMRLDISARASDNSSSFVTSNLTVSKTRKPEILLVSK